MTEPMISTIGLGRYFRKYKFPASVYQTTYYVDRELPVFNLFCSYLLWKRRGEQLPAPSELGLTEEMDLRTEAGRHRVVRALIEVCERENLTGSEKNEIAKRLTKVLGIAYEAVARKRILQLMNAGEIREIASSGIDIQDYHSPSPWKTSAINLPSIGKLPEYQRQN